MSWAIYDADGYVGDLATTKGLADLRDALQQDDDLDTQVLALLERGQTKKLPETIQALKTIRNGDDAPGGDIEKTLSNLITLLGRCDGVVIISNGYDPRPEEDLEKSDRSGTKRFRELPRIDRDNPSAVKAQKAVANRIGSLFKKQQGQFFSQGRQALKSALKKVDATDPRVQQIIDQIDLEGFAFIPAELAPFLKQIFSETGAQVLQNIGIDSEASIAAVDDAALEFAQARAAEMVGMKWVDGELVDNPNAAWSIEETTRDRINSIIVNAFSGTNETSGWRDIAGQIEALTTDSDVFSAARAEMIARTEIGNAQMEGAAAGYEHARDMGLELEKKWLDNDSTDECGANAAEDWIPYDDDFSSGDDMPLAHPRCECSMAVRVVNPPEEVDVGEPPYK